jgi:hypothetical protein
MLGKRVAFSVAIFLAGAGAVQAADIVWEVSNPFRFYKRGESFRMHEQAYRLVRGPAEQPVPVNIIRRVERCLNDPERADPAPAIPGCVALWRQHSAEDRRRGWAARTLDDVCYERNGRPRRYLARCERQSDGRMETEDYILPAAHVVTLNLAPARQTEPAGAQCTWSSKARSAADWTRVAQKPCREPVNVRVPYSRNRAASGLEIKVELPDARSFTELVVVDDVLVVALGDSFSSGEGNPDQPIKLSAFATLDYAPPPPDTMSKMAPAPKRRPMPPAVTTPSGYKPDVYLLPRRELRGESSSRMYDPLSTEFTKAFWEANAKWLSPDCHRSQYGYPVRAALAIALEDRHRAVTLLHLSCSGAEVTDGVLGPMEPREDRRQTRQVASQISHMTDLLCREDARKGAWKRTYQLPVFEPRNTNPKLQAFDVQTCGKDGLKRPIDLVLTSIGGNDVGFSALAAYVMLDNLSDIAWVGRFLDKKSRFGPEYADAHLDALDERMQALKDVLQDGFGVAPPRVVQTSYEPIQNDETGEICGTFPNLGMDVHPALQVKQPRLEATARFLDRLLARLQCITARGPGCPADLKTGSGTGFTLIISHQPEFKTRGLCARGPGDADGANMQMPRDIVGEFKPYNPASFRPYASRARLFRTPNDSFLTANTHREDETPIADILQPAYAALYSGAIHPTAEGHALVADHVMLKVRPLMAGR